MSCDAPDKTKKVLEHVAIERSYQDKKWGEANDDKNTDSDWLSYMMRYAGLSVVSKSYIDKRRHLVRVAALAVAAIEAGDRNDGFPANR